MEKSVSSQTRHLKLYCQNSYLFRPHRAQAHAQTILARPCELTTQIFVMSSDDMESDATTSFGWRKKIDIYIPLRLEVAGVPSFWRSPRSLQPQAIGCIA